MTDAPCRLLLPTACNPCFHHPTPHPPVVVPSICRAIAFRTVVEARTSGLDTRKNTKMRRAGVARSNLLFFLVSSPDVRASTTVRNAIALDIHADVPIFFCTTPLMLQIGLLNTGVLSIAVQHVCFCINFCSRSL